MAGRVAIPVLMTLMALAAPTCAETDLTALTDAERAAFHAEIRAVLLAYPDLAVPKALVPTDTTALYADDIASDLRLIAENRAALFSADRPAFGPETAGQRIALFVGPDCPACDQAETDLRALASRHDLRVTLIDTSLDPELAKRMTVDELPFYVLPKMMLRGHMPEAVLDRYLEQGTGQ